jgi:hypothetical protein
MLWELKSLRSAQSTHRETFRLFCDSIFFVYFLNEFRYAQIERCGRYHKAFVDNAFDGIILHNTPEADFDALLRSVGIGNFMHVQRIVLLLKEIRARPLPPS